MEEAMNADQMKELVELCKHQAIAGRRGYWRATDLVVWDETHDMIEPLLHGAPTPLGEKYCTWIPHAFDCQRPERSLWGMIGGDYLEKKIIREEREIVRVILVHKRMVSDTIFRESVLPIALAKAIIWQHERRLR